MLDPSLNLTPAHPVAAPRSDPARSIIDSLTIFVCPFALVFILIKTLGQKVFQLFLLIYIKYIKYICNNSVYKPYLENSMRP